MPVSSFVSTAGFHPDTHLRLLVLAGAEDVLADLGVRQALKNMPSEAKL